MPKSPSTAVIGPDGLCSYCGQAHLTQHGRPSCMGHVRFDRDTYVPGQDRVRLDQPRPCRRPANRGVDVCHMHGGAAAQVAAAGQQRDAEEKTIRAARKLIPDLDDRAPIRNPLERLLELAAEADAFRESLRQLANDVETGISAGSGEQLRAEVATYRSALKDVTDLLVAIARLDVETVLARVEARKVDFLITALTSGLTDAGLDDTQKRAVMTSVTRHLRSVPRVAG
jgi:hypothetical protein